MIKGHFSKEIEVKYSDTECNFALKPAVLLNFLQDYASENAESLGFGYSFVSTNSLMWFLLKYRMEFVDYPMSVGNLILKTEPRGFAKLFAYRDFELYRDEKCLGRMSSVWALVNSDRSIVPIVSALDNPNMSHYQKREDDLGFSKIPPMEKVDYEKTFEIRYEDIDVNMHANNCNYIIWALEPLSVNFRTNHKIKTLDMVFKKEIKYGNDVISQVEFKSNEKTLHMVKNAVTGDELCIIQIDWVCV